jgi:hypothetical protein
MYPTSPNLPSSGLDSLVTPQPSNHMSIPSLASSSVADPIRPNLHVGGYAQGSKIVSPCITACTKSICGISSMLLEENDDDEGLFIQPQKSTQKVLKKELKK